MSDPINVRGDRNFIGVIDSERSNQNAEVDNALAAQHNLTARSAGVQILGAATTQNVMLPQATGAEMAKGWSIRIFNNGAATLAVRSYHATTPVLIENIAPGDAYDFHLIDNANDAGTWKFQKHNDGDVEGSAKVVQTTNATTDWGTAVDGMYSITITGATHGLGTSIDVRCEEVNGSLCSKYEAGKEEVDNISGDVTIYVNEIPDARCATRIVLS